MTIGFLRSIARLEEESVKELLNLASRGLMILDMDIEQAEHRAEFDQQGLCPLTELRRGHCSRSQMIRQAGRSR